MTADEYREKVLAEIDRVIGAYARRATDAASEDVERAWNHMQSAAIVLHRQIAAIPPVTDNGDDQP